MEDGGSYMQSILNYIDEWAGYVPMGMSDIQFPVPITGLLTDLDHDRNNAIRPHQKRAERNGPSFKIPTPL